VSSKVEYRTDNPLICAVTFHVGMRAGREMSISTAKDDNLLLFYESVRRQVEADASCGGRYRFVGETARQYAERLREEMDRRRLKFTPIDWHR
jgi:site-specific DNA-adenine methylase